MPRKGKYKPTGNPRGRPTIMTQETIGKLEYAFSIGCTDTEACLYANIAMSTMYDHQNLYPDFVERKRMLKEKPVLKARKTLVENLEDPKYALEYLARKKKDEFSLRTETTGADGSAVAIQVLEEHKKSTPQQLVEAFKTLMKNDTGTKNQE